MVVIAEKLLSQWKKVYQQDLDYVANEMRNSMSTPCMVLLDGEVGAGKTTLLKSFFPQLEVSSPTYSVVNELGDIVHGDFYRIEKEEELMHLELPLYLEKKNYFFVEWGKKFYHQLRRQIDAEWSVYQVKITANASTQGPSRDYALYHLMD